MSNVLKCHITQEQGEAEDVEEGVSTSTTGSSTLSNSRNRGSLASGSSSSQEWIGVCNAARRTLAELVAPLASVRWQVLYSSSLTSNK
jgi:hypothetical protein